VRFKYENTCLNEDLLKIQNFPPIIRSYKLLKRWFQSFKEYLTTSLQPFIRFFNLTSNEFMDKVLPFIGKFYRKNYVRIYLSLSDPNSKLSGKSNRVTKENSWFPSNLKTVDSKITTNPNYRNLWWSISHCNGKQKWNSSTLLGLLKIVSYSLLRIYFKSCNWWEDATSNGSDPSFGESNLALMFGINLQDN
jgi:hypothetical protein